jgi:hypothetical protein
VRSSVEETLNGLLDAEADRICGAERYQYQRELVQMVGTIRERREQWAWLVIGAGAALLVGILISPVLASWLPFGWDGQVAAYVMRADRWNAGGALMQAQNPDAWSALMNAGKLSVDNQAALVACREAAAKTKKEQRCSVVVPAP